MKDSTKKYIFGSLPFLLLGIAIGYIIYLLTRPKTKKDNKNKLKTQAVRTEMKRQKICNFSYILPGYFHVQNGKSVVVVDVKRSYMEELYRLLPSGAPIKIGPQIFLVNKWIDEHRFQLNGKIKLPSQIVRKSPYTTLQAKTCYENFEYIGPTEGFIGYYTGTAWVPYTGTLDSLINVWIDIDIEIDVEGEVEEEGGEEGGEEEAPEEEAPEEGAPEVEGEPEVEGGVDPGDIILDPEFDFPGPIPEPDVDPIPLPEIDPPLIPDFELPDGLGGPILPPPSGGNGPGFFDPRIPKDQFGSSATPNLGGGMRIPGSQIGSSIPSRLPGFRIPGSQFGSSLPPSFDGSRVGGSRPTVPSTQIRSPSISGGPSPFPRGGSFGGGTRMMTRKR